MPTFFAPDPAVAMRELILKVCPTAVKFVADKVFVEVVPQPESKYPYIIARNFGGFTQSTDDLMKSLVQVQAWSAPQKQEDSIALYSQIRGSRVINSSNVGDASIPPNGEYHEGLQDQGSHWFEVDQGGSGAVVIYCRERQPPITQVDQSTERAVSSGLWELAISGVSGF